MGLSRRSTAVLAPLLTILLTGCYNSGSNAAPPIRDTGAAEATDAPTEPATEPEPDLFDPCSPENMCAGMECGWNEECAVDCGSCPEGIECVDHRCPGCERSCEGRHCGIDACGRRYGTCPGTQICNQEGRCEDAGWTAPCREIVEESHFCLTMVDTMPAGTDVVVIGVDSGTVCPLELDLGETYPLLPEDSSIAWLGGYLHVCSSDGGEASLKRISLMDGSIESSTYWCASTARYGDGLLVRTFTSELALFPSFEAVFTYDGVAVPISLHGGRMTAHCDSLYSAGWTSDEIMVHALPDGGAPTHTIAIERSMAATGGFSVTDDGLLIVSAMWPDSQLEIFDVHTGEFIDEVPLLIPVPVTPLIWGLDCTTNP